jgi:cysteinyl-tRNA synthetase
MALRVYNTLSRQLEDFKTIEEGEVRVYICGLTVYDHMHIGHARTYLAFDSILRYLKYRNYRVKYIQNVTDVDDKIIKRAKERKLDPIKMSADFAEHAKQDQASLGLVKPDFYPKVTENIEGIIAATKALIENGHAYVTDKGVYFDVSKFPEYGMLSHQDTEQLSQHRIEPDPEKRTPIDFSLWKKVQPGELGFESPWGFGRPGWHIECSVMSRKHLGDQIDIHGGALDLIFPHHENEVAQSEALTGKRPFVRYWLHTGFLNSSGEKMSKSLGNIVAVREFLKTNSAEAFRLFILQTHYRSPIDYSPQHIQNAQKALERLRNFRGELSAAAARANGQGGEAQKIMSVSEEMFIECMDEDFNTPKAVAAVFEAVKCLNASIAGGGESGASLNGALEVFDRLLGVLGFDFSSSVELSPEEQALVEERSRCRKGKNWAESDRIRDELLKRGIKLKDKADGSTAIERA